MALIKKIKLPTENEPRDIGALSSNIVYDGETTTVGLNEKIAAIFTAIGDINSFDIAITPTLPAIGNDHTIYFIPQGGGTTHDEYMYIGNTWELIGTTTIDLTNYVQFSDLATVATTGVYSDLIDEPNLAAVATSGSYLDLQDVPEIPTVPTNISYFTNDSGYITGIDVTPALNSGVSIGTVDGTALYAPTPTAVNVSPVLNSGVAVATITVDSSTKTIYVPQDVVGTVVSITNTLSSGVSIGDLTIDGVTTTLYVPSADASVYALNLASYTKQQLAEGIQDSADAAVISNIAANYEEGVTKVKFSFIDNYATPDVVATAAGPKFSITLNGNTFNDVMKFTFAGVYLDDAAQALAPPAYIGSIYIVPNANLVMLMGSDVVRELDRLEGEVGTLSTAVNDLATVATTGDYDDLSNTPDLSGYATTDDIPENISDLNDDIGIITSETDPVFTASPAYGITTTDITNWNNKSVVSITNTLSTGTAIGNLTINGVTTTIYSPTPSQSVTEIVDLGNIEVPDSVMNALSLGVDGDGQITLSPMPDLTNLLTKDLIFKATLTYQSNIMGTMMFRNQNFTNQGLETYKLFSCDLVLQTGSRAIAGRLSLLFVDSGENTLVFLVSQLFAPAIVEDDIQTWISNQGFATESWVTGQNYITSADLPTVPTAISDLTDDIGIATMNDIPTDVSELNNDAGYIADLSVNQILASGITIGSIGVDGVTTTLYAPNNEPVFIMTEFDGDTHTVSLPEGQTFASIKAFIDSGRNVFVGLDDYDNSCWFSLSEYEPNRLTFSSALSDYHQEVLVIYSDNHVSNPWKDFRTTITNTLSSGVTIGTITASGTTTTLYAPAASTPVVYSMSMSGPTINLLADGVAASTITLPIWDGTLD